MKNKEKFFKAFLAIYAVLLVLHAWNELDWGILTASSLLAGLLLAFFAHQKKGYVTILLLAIHMTIEWSHHLSFGASYSASEFILQGIHAVFDIVFLVGEFRRHKKGAIPAIIVGVISALFIVSFFPEGEESAVFPIEAVILGGILGCVGAHLFEKKHSHSHDHKHSH